MARHFVTLDVFTAQPFAGNPLAVVMDADGLDTAAMQAIAREFNLPETVFVLPPSSQSSRARLRIFTPVRELPFAGHPTVGTAVLLGALEGEGGDLVLEERIGLLRCSVERIDGERGRARFLLPQEPRPGDEVEDAAPIAAALGLTLDDLGCDAFAPANWSAGNMLTFVPVRGLDAISRACPQPGSWDSAFPANERLGAYLFCRETVDAAHQFHARMFAPAFGVPEDPATGSAAAAFAGLLAHDGGIPAGKHRVAIEQGYEMGRPSVIQLELTMHAGRLNSAYVGGEAVRVMQGIIAA